MISCGVRMILEMRLKTSTLLLLAVLLAGLMTLAAVGWYRLHSDEPRGSVPTVLLPDFQETRSKAEGGDDQAAFLLAEIYAEGKQVPQNYKEAGKWYRKAAERGIAKAQYQLGVLHDIGQGVAKDESEAASWYRKAAEQGNADAQYTLAGMYGLGRGVSPDPKEALKWYHRAAEQGDALARYNLAERYERGRDVAQDFVEAYKWHSLAANRGLPDAAAARDNLQRQMNSAQVSEARKRIEEFKAKHPEPKSP
jgi:TPR repeat protein